MKLNNLAMRFKNRAEKMEWLKAAGAKINEMGCQRRIAVLRGEFGRAYDLLRGINFARREFKKISESLRPH